MENTITKKEQGKKGRAKGKRFEIEVRKDLEEKGFFVTKWQNQVDFEKDSLIHAKNKYNPFLKRIMNEGSGLPDYMAHKLLRGRDLYEVIGVECKVGKYLSAEEKKKCSWLLQKKVFSKILIAHKPSRGVIAYENFTEK